MAKFVRARQLIRAFKQSATPTVLEGLNLDDVWVDTDDHAMYVCTSLSPVTFASVGGSSGGLSDGDYGDVTVSGTGTVITVKTKTNLGVTTAVSRGFF